MPKYEPNLSARRAHANFARTLREAEQTQRNLVLWFADIYRRKLYAELGYTSIYAYTAERHGFSRRRCSAFIRLAESLTDLPALHESVAAGEMPWTKARELVRVATPETERAWVEEAKHSSRRSLEKKIAAVRGRVREARGFGRGQEMLALAAVPTGAVAAEAAVEPGRASGASAATGDTIVPSRERVERAAIGDLTALMRTLPEDLRLRFTALQYAEYGALVERLRKDGWKIPVEDLIVAGLAALLEQGRGSESGRADLPQSDEREGTNPPRDAEPRSNRSPGVGSKRPARIYQVVVRQCPDCAHGEVLTGRGARALRPAELEAVLCDARVHRPGKRNTATVPPALRRAVLERDGHRCRVAGCGSTRFLAVHHREPRSAGGANTIENLVTLCASCHRAIHDMGEPARQHAEGLLGGNGAVQRYGAPPGAHRLPP